MRIPAGYSQPGRNPGVCKIVELSAGGCLVDLTGLDPRGPELTLHFRLGGEMKEFEVRARVVRLKEDVGTALEFISISPEQREFLLRYVEEAAAEVTRRIRP